MANVPLDPQFEQRKADILTLVGAADWALTFDRATQQYLIVGNPEINLQFEDPQNPGVWIDVPDNSLTAIPGTYASGGDEVVNFRFQNLGGADLDLTGTLVDQGVSNMAALAFGAISPTTLPRALNAPFTVTINGSGSGGGTFDFDMPNDDADENPYRALLGVTFT